MASTELHPEGQSGATGRPVVRWVLGLLAGGVLAVVGYHLIVNQLLSPGPGSVATAFLDALNQEQLDRARHYLVAEAHDAEEAILKALWFPGTSYTINQVQSTGDFAHVICDVQLSPEQQKEQLAQIRKIVPEGMFAFASASQGGKRELSLRRETDQWLIFPRSRWRVNMVSGVTLDADIDQLRAASAAQEAAEAFMKAVINADEASALEHMTARAREAGQEMLAEQLEPWARRKKAEVPAYVSSTPPLSVGSECEVRVAVNPFPPATGRPPGPPANITGKKNRIALPPGVEPVSEVLVTLRQEDGRWRVRTTKEIYKAITSAPPNSSSSDAPPRMKEKMSPGEEGSVKKPEELQKSSKQTGTRSEPKSIFRDYENPPAN